MLLKIQGQTHQAAALMEPFKCSRSLAKGVLRMRTARGIVCSRLYYNHACPRNDMNSQNKRGLLANQNVDSKYNV